MKRRSIVFSLVWATTSVMFLANCSGDKTGGSHEDHKEATNHSSTSSQTVETSEPQFQVDETFQNQLSSLFASYIELKEAFVASDVNKIRSEAEETKAALTKVDMKLVSGAAHNDWMNYHSGMQKSLNAIESSEIIEEQRKAFSTLSDYFYNSVKAFGLGGKAVFYEYCPMAFNNEGAYWLSDQEKIRNPYFGEKMLSCGEVREKLM